jgi:hypothetical protein
VNLPLRRTMLIGPCYDAALRRLSLKRLPRLNHRQHRQLKLQRKDRPLRVQSFL